MRRRTRNCMLNDMLADGCDGPSESLEPCYVPCQNIDMGWENWSEWSGCDENNKKQRTRRCAMENCVGPEIESVSCFETNRVGEHNIVTLRSKIVEILEKRREIFV